MRCYSLLAPFFFHVKKVIYEAKTVGVPNDKVRVCQERMKFDYRTQMNADNPDFKYKVLTEEIIRIFYRVYNKRGYNMVFWKRFMRMRY